MPDRTDVEVTPLPRWFLRSAMLAGGVLALWALAMVILAAFVAPRPAWILFGFETMVVASGVVAVAFGRGKFQDGPGLALACVAGTVFAAAALSWLGNRQGVTLIEGRGPVSLTIFAAARVGIAALVGLGAAYAVLRRTAVGRGYAWRAIAAVAGIGVLGAVMMFGRGAMAGWSGVIQGAISLLWLGAVMGLICAGGHCVIRAFESGRTEREGA